MIKLHRHNSFNELKSAGNLTKGPDIGLFHEYKMLIELLQSSIVAQKATSIKSLKSKKENG